MDEKETPKTLRNADPERFDADANQDPTSILMHIHNRIRTLPGLTKWASSLKKYKA